MAGCTTSARAPGPEPEPDLPRPRQTRLWRDLKQLATRGPLVVAHRGNSSEHPENTLPAFASAVEIGADLVELDVRQTRDGALVCLHDETLDRTTDSRTATELGREKVRVDAVDLDQLAGLDAGAWLGAAHRGARVPTLEQALDVVQHRPGQRSITMIERKAGDAARFVELLRARGLVDDVVVMDFDWDWLREVHALEPGLTIAALGSGELDTERLRELATTGAGIVHWRHTDLRRETWELLHAQGYLTCVYTVDADLTMLGCIEAGLSAVTTNRPRRLLRLVGR